MKIIIIGCGKVGAYVAKQLLDSHHQVTIIERDQKRFEQVLQIFSQAEVLHGDGTSPILLEKCSVETANAVAYLTGKDEINLVGSTVAKFNYAVDRVVARVNNPKNEWLFNADMGVDSRVSQASLLASVIINEVNIESTEHTKMTMKMRLLNLFYQKALLFMVRLSKQLISQVMLF